MTSPSIKEKAEVPTDDIVYINNEFHRVTSVSSSLDEDRINTFCGESAALPSTIDDIVFSVPIHCLDSSSLCWDCERQNAGIQFDRFPLYDSENDGDKYSVRGIVRFGETDGKQILEVLRADSLQSAKEKFENMYSDSVSEFLRISRWNDEEKTWITVEEVTR
jgi:hypothetical protein